MTDMLTSFVAFFAISSPSVWHAQVDGGQHCLNANASIGRPPAEYDAAKVRANQRPGTFEQPLAGGRRIRAPGRKSTVKRHRSVPFKRDPLSTSARLPTRIPATCPQGTDGKGTL